MWMETRTRVTPRCRKKGTCQRARRARSFTGLFVAYSRGERSETHETDTLHRFCVRAGQRTSHGLRPSGGQGWRRRHGRRSAVERKRERFGGGGGGRPPTPREK